MKRILLMQFTVLFCYSFIQQFYFKEFILYIVSPQYAKKLYTRVFIAVLLYKKQNWKRCND